MTTNTATAYEFRAVFEGLEAVNAIRTIRAALLFTDKKSLRPITQNVLINAAGGGKVRLMGTDGGAAFVSTVCASACAECDRTLMLTRELLDAALPALKPFEKDLTRVVISSDGANTTLTAALPEPMTFTETAYKGAHRGYESAVLRPTQAAAPAGHAPKNATSLVKLKYLEAACKAAKILQSEKGVTPGVGLSEVFDGDFGGAALSVADRAAVLILGYKPADHEGAGAYAAPLSQAIPAVFD